MIDIVPYDPMRHRRGVREVLAKNGWEEHYIAGQLAGSMSSRVIRNLGGAVRFASAKWRTV